MPIHDWTRVDAGIYHDFHNAWIAELRNTLNRGLLPTGFYAMIERHAGKYIADVLTLDRRPGPVATSPQAMPGGVALAEAPPKVRQQLTLSTSARSRRKTLAIRHVSGHRLIALMEMISPANKDRQEHVQEILNKLEDALVNGIHLLVVDLFPPGSYDPQGIHGALWDRLGDEAEPLSIQEPLTLAAYVADTPVRAFVEHVAVGSVLPDMPLFLDLGHYINAPLEATYDETWRGTPSYWREVLEGNGSPS